MSYLGDLPIVISTLITERHTHIPVRKHRKKRIQKKWIKRYGFKVEIVGPFMFNGRMIVHPTHLSILKGLSHE